MDLRLESVAAETHLGDRLSPTVEVHVAVAKCHAEMFRVAFSRAVSYERSIAVPRVRAGCFARRAPIAKQVGEPAVFVEDFFG